MLDLRQIREDPEPARKAPRAASTRPSSTRRSSWTSAGARCCPSSRNARGRTRRASGSAGPASGEDADDAITETRELSTREKGSRRSCAAWRTAGQPHSPCRTSPTRPRRPRTRSSARSGGRKTGRSHVELLGDDLDTERAARVSGSRFVYLKGPLVRLELALVQWAVSLLDERGFTPVVPPVLVRERALVGTGMLPDTEQQLYQVPEDELYLVGTSEVPARLASTPTRSSARASSRSLRRLLALLPARGGRGRQGHAGPFACTSSTRWRCSRSWSRSSRRTSTSGCWRSRRRSSRRSGSRTGW